MKMEIEPKHSLGVKFLPGDRVVLRKDLESQITPKIEEFIIHEIRISEGLRILYKLNENYGFIYEEDSLVHVDNVRKHLLDFLSKKYDEVQDW